MSNQFLYVSSTISTTGHSSTIHNNQNYTDKFKYPDVQQPKQPEKEQDFTGAVVLLAPPRKAGSIWNVDRFCYLLQAVRSVDTHLNSHYGPYPIIILVAKDYMFDPKGVDAVYTEEDRALIRQWAPNSTIIFEELELYSGPALEPNTTQTLIRKWRQGWDGSVPGRDLGYQSMCRLWSGRIQALPFLQRYQYYMRLDDDGLFIGKLTYDPFEKMKQSNLTYVFRRPSHDHWGIEKLWEIAQPHLSLSQTLPFTERGEYHGSQPYNNFHISLTSFWTSPEWLSFWNDLNEQHAFFKYRVGDANVHAIAVMMMKEGRYEMWPDIPYVHNSNDMPYEWGQLSKSWQTECHENYEK